MSQGMSDHEQHESELRRKADEARLQEDRTLAVLIVEGIQLFRVVWNHGADKESMVNATVAYIGRARKAIEANQRRF